MAEFYQYGGANGGTYASHFSCRLSVWENSYDINSNSSNVGYRLELISGSSGRFSDLTANFTVCLDSQGSPQYVAQGSGRYTSQSYNSAQTICEGTTTIYHNADGTKNIGCWASLDFQSHTYSPGDFSPSGYMDLTTIPRYADFVGHRLNAVELESVEVAYHSNKNLVSAESSLNGGSWRPLTIKSGQWNVANNTVVYTVDHLNPNTNYTIETRIAHVNGLWRYGGQLSFKTKDIVRIANNLNSDFGQNVNINFSNLANGTAKLTVKIENNEICTRENLTSNYVLAFTKEELSKMVKLLKNETTEITYIVTTNNKYTSTTKAIITLKANIYKKKNGKWVKAKLYKKNNNWKLTKLFFKVNGRWRNTK